MSNAPANSTSISQLAANVLTDLQTLLTHAGKVFASDSKGISRTAQETVWLTMAACAVLTIGGTLVCFALIHALTALFPAMPLWALFGAVGMAVLGIGIGLIMAARTRIAALQPLNDESAALVGEAVAVGNRVVDTIESAKAAVCDTVATVTGAVASIKDATNLSHQVEKHPWVMFAGAAGLGYVGGMLIDSVSGPSSPHPARPSNNGGSHGDVSVKSAPGGEWHVAREPQVVPGVIAKLGEALGPQAGVLREIAIGTLFGLVRDLMRDAVSKQFEKPVDDFFDGAARKFGGRPVETSQASASSESARV